MYEFTRNKKKIYLSYVLSDDSEPLIYLPQSPEYYIGLKIKILIISELDLKGTILYMQANMLNETMYYDSIHTTSGSFETMMK